MDAVECLNVSCSKAGWNGAGTGVVRDCSLRIRPGEFVGFCGPDGCGKGLLLNVLGLLERPDAGRLIITGEDTGALGDAELAAFRNATCGFLFGHPYLLPAFTVAENVAMPLFRIRGGDAGSAQERTLAVLQFTGLDLEGDELARGLDAADRWRAAMARALVHEPELLIAISPPAEEVLLPLARRAADLLGVTVLWAGGREALRPFADRIVEMRDGCCAGEELTA